MYFFHNLPFLMLVNKNWLTIHSIMLTDINFDLKNLLVNPEINKDEKKILLHY